MKIRCRVNGVSREVETPPMVRLLDMLRETLRLTGTKEGCGEGECGACTVLLNGQPVNSCLVPACHAEGASIVTVEGLSKRGKLSPLQEAFLHGGAQCGICTPGMLMAAQALLQENGAPKEAVIREALAGNLCRCTGYVKIVEAVREAAKVTRAAAAAKKPARKKKAAGKEKAGGKQKPAMKKAARKKPATSRGKRARRA